MVEVADGDGRQLATEEGARRSTGRRGKGMGGDSGAVAAAAVFCG
jgi:hypothetical protein